MFSGALVRSLPGGWMFSLANEKYANRAGQTFEGPGTAPRLRTPVLTEEEFAAGRDSAFDRAGALLTTRR
ncbi:hypothetical protein [Streptomyces sp. CAU 1734]|uniref:hypothetical protein n=1 Tax=Streptomyces sp. CAU 1734 TaxID=3140360 RepID=UPI003260A891